MYLPFRLSFLILNVAFPLVLVVVLIVFLYFLPLIVRYIVAFDKAFLPDLSFIVYFLTLVFALTLGACNLEQRVVELGAAVSYNEEMTEQTSQQVTVEITDKSLDLEDLEVTFLLDFL